MVFERRSKRKRMLLSIFVMIILIGISLLVSADRREVPAGQNEDMYGFSNDQVGDAISNYLLIQKEFSWKVREDSFNICSVENLDPDKELFPLYVWSYCGEYVLEGGKLKTVSGSSGPVKVDYPNELSFYDVERFSHEAPGDGSRYGEDVKRIFPENIEKRIFDFDPGEIIKRNEEAALEKMTVDGR